MELRAGDFVTDAVRLVRPLAEGGMGRVWVAEHLGLHSQVVVKLMSREMTARDDGADRFAREAAVAAAIKSPHVVQVFDHGVTKKPGASVAGIPYIVMELLEGKDLSVVLEERGRLEPAEAAQVVVQIGKALAKAHKAGIIHRDIKPENIFLCANADSGEDVDLSDSLATSVHVKLLDFGTAKQAKASSATIPGEIMGTPYYMSPEQAIGATLDPRTDMWSLGVVAFEMLTGVKPFEGANVGAIALAIHAGLPPISSRVSDLPIALDIWFAKTCAQLPHERFASMREMTAAFVEALTGEVSNGDTTEAIVLPRRISVRPSSPPGSDGARASRPSNDEMRKTLPTSIEPSLPPPAYHPHPAFSTETASFGSQGRAENVEARAQRDAHAHDHASVGAVEVPSRAPQAILDSIAPLTASLPERGAGQRPTKIAAAVVGAAAFAVMAAIVMHRPSAPEAAATTAAAAPAPPPPKAEPVPEPVPVPVPEPVATPSKDHAHAPSHGKKAKAGAGTKAAASAAPMSPLPGAAPDSSAAAPAKPGKKGASHAPTKQEDDDLAKLIKAGGPDAPAPAPTPLPPAPAPTPIPPKPDAPPTP